MTLLWDPAPFLTCSTAAGCHWIQPGPPGQTRFVICPLAMSSQYVNPVPILNCSIAVVSMFLNWAGSTLKYIEKHGSTLKYWMKHLISHKSTCFCIFKPSISFYLCLLPWLLPFTWFFILTLITLYCMNHLRCFPNDYQHHKLETFINKSGSRTTDTSAVFPVFLDAVE